MTDADPLPDFLATATREPMRRNIELKARLPDLEFARRVAATVATDRLPAQHQIDTYFECSTGRLKLREINGATAHLVWYQRSNDLQARGSDYLLVPVAEPALLKQALAGALGVRGVVDKQREIFLFHNVRIHLDCVAGRGTFLEFEAVLSTPADEPVGHARLTELRRRFEIADTDLIAGSYGDA